MKTLLRHAAIYLFHLLFVRPVLFFGAGARYRRKGPLPDGPCVVVANHNSHLDAAILLTMFPLRRVPHVHPVAAADYFGKTWLRRTMAMLLMNAIPIERRPSAPGADPLEGAIDVLKQGDSLILFPEGSRGEAGVVARFRPGVGRLVRRVPGLLVVPVFLSGPERIWPRGQVVPVPLIVDATVGRAQTYDSNAEAREITDLIRRDVLALAPPPPPLPAPRPAPPVSIAVCGLDLEERRRVFRAICSRLGGLGTTLGIGDPVVEADPGGEREMTPPIPQISGRAWLGLLERVFRLGGRFRGGKFFEMVERARIGEALAARPTARFVVTDGSALIDLVAWGEADFYSGVFDEAGVHRLMQYLEGRRKIAVADWWRFLRKAPEVWLINVFDLARPAIPDVLVFASPPAWRLMQRLRSAGAALGSHQNEAFLERLGRAYAQVGTVLRKRRRVEFLVYDLADGDHAAIAEEVARVVAGRVPEAAARVEDPGGRGTG